MTFAEYSESWLERAEQGGWYEPSTLNLIHGHAHNHLVPAFGEIPVAELRPGDVQLWILEQTQMAPATLYRILSTLKLIIDDAYSHGERAAPLDFAALRKPRAMRHRTGIDPSTDGLEVAAVVLTPERVESLASAAGDHYGPIIRFLAYTGLRFGELAGLEQRDVVQHEQRPRLNVERALKRDGSIGPTKTRRRRTVYLLEPAVAALTDWQLTHTTQRRDGGPLFVTHRGKRLQHANFHHKVWTPALEAWANQPWVERESTITHGETHRQEPTAGTPPGLAYPHEWVKTTIGEREYQPSPVRLRIHDLRHTYASLLIRHGVPLQFVADQLGHSSTITTQRVYAHWLAEDSDSIVDELDQALRG